MDTASEPDPSFDLESEFRRFARTGDVGALARVFDATAPGLVSVARHLCRENAAAEDLVQQTFVSAIERAGTFDDSRSLLAWLTGILALHARKQARSAARALDPARLPGRAAEDPHRAAQGAEIVAAVEQAVGTLPERYATVLRLHLREQLVPREIARRTGVEPGTARVQLHRGLRMLRDALPAGLSGFAASPLASGADPAGLAAMREAVLARAELVAPPVVAATGTSTIALWCAAAAICVAGVAGGFVLLRGERDADALARAPAVVVPVEARGAATAEPAPELARAAVVDAERADAARSVAAASAESTPRLARVVGRLLLPDGSPAIGAELELRAREAGEERTRAFPPPPDWKSPPATRTGADGRFTVEVDPPRAFQFLLEARLDGFARMSWRWSELGAESVADVGERAFEPACTVIVRVLGRDGAPMTVPFDVSATPRRMTFAPKSGAPEPFLVNARRDEALAAYVLEGLPPGECEVSARAESTDRLPSRIVAIDPREPARVDLVYEGVDPTKRIVVTCSTSPFHALRPDPARVRLTGPMGEVPRSAAMRGVIAVNFDDLPPGSYTVEVDDPRFETFVRAGLQPGERVRATLRGSAALRVVLRADGKTLEVEPERLTLAYLGTNRMPSEFDLGDREALPVIGGFLTGIVPGNCELRVRVAGFPETRVALGEIAPGARREVVVDLESGRTVRGVVRASEGGAASSGVVVMLTQGELAGHGLARGSSVNGGRIPPATHRTKSDADGRFEFGALQPGRWTLRAVWSEWLYADRALELGAEEVGELEIVEPPHGSLDVELLLPDGATQAGLALGLRAPGGPQARAFLDLVDEVEFAPGETTRVGFLPVGRVGLSLSTRTVNSSSSGPVVQEVDIVGGDTAHTVLDLRTALPARIEARAFVEGRLQLEMRYDVRRADGGELGHHMLAFASDDGVLGGVVAPGRYQFVFGGAQEGWTWTDPRTIDARAGEVLKLEFQLPLVERTLVLRYASGALAKEREITVVALDELEQTETKVRTDSLGRVRLPRIAGRYRLRIDGADGAPFDWSRDTPEPFEVRIPAR